MNYRAIFLIISLVFIFTFGFFVYIRNRRSLINFWYTVFVSFLALWTFGLLMMYLSATAGSKLFWANFLYLVGSLIPSSFFCFSLIFPSDKALPIRKVGLIFLPNFILFILYFFTSLMIRKVVYENGIIKYFVYGPLHLLFDIQVVFFFGWAFWNLYRKYKVSAGRTKMQLRYILVATILGVVLAGTTNVAIPAFLYNCSLAWLGPSFTFPMFSIIAYAIVRYRLMDINVAVTRAGIFLIIYALILGFPLYVGYKTNSWIISTSLAIAFATVGPFVYRSLNRKAEEVLLVKQRRYQTILLKGAKGLMKEHRLDRLLKWIVRAVRKTVGIRYVALFLDDKKNQLFTLKTKEDNGEIPDDLVFSYQHPFIAYMRERKGPFLYEEIPEPIRHSLNIPFEVDIIIPSFIEDKYLGFIILGEKLNREFYSIDDLNVFKILAHQAGLAIENAQLYSELQNETKALKEAIKKLNETQNQLIQSEKMAAVGRLASGIAHELRNPLSIVLQGIEFLENNLVGLDNKSKKAIKSIKNSVDRADNIIIELLKFSGSSKLEFASLELCQLMKDTLSLVENRMHLGRISLVKNFPEKDMQIHADRNMLEQVFFNLYSNAIDAMSEGGQLELNVFPHRHDVVIEIIDTGKGIPTDILPDIFDPFFTTKDVGKGVGLGLSIVCLILERHNGTINVESKVNEGTRFIIKLPRKVENKKEEAIT
ncbi:MAG: ATP-binding protein [Candidatus Omnitrophica bacterium]|nr:ATP-binding protein [Candidatus Omnitrophota bacterium]